MIRFLGAGGLSFDPTPQTMRREELLDFTKAVLIYGASFIIVGGQWNSRHRLADPIVNEMGEHIVLLVIAFGAVLALSFAMPQISIIYFIIFSMAKPLKTFLSSGRQGEPTGESRFRKRGRKSPVIME